MKRFLLLFVYILAILSLQGQEEKPLLLFDFPTQEITDIVYAISISQNTPIVCDDTVFGQTSFRFSGNDFNEALEAFLRYNRLYAKLINQVLVLSKVDISKNENYDNQYTINAYDISPSKLFDKISEVAKIPVVYELLPNVSVSLHVENVKIEEAISIVMQGFPDYSVTKGEKSVKVARSPIINTYNNSTVYGSSGKVVIEKDFNEFDIDIEEGSFYESIEKLFLLQEVDFCNLLPSDRLITRFLYSYSDFDVVLTTLCAQASAAFTVHNGMYVVYALEETNEALQNSNRHWQTISLRFIPSSQVSSLIQQRFPNYKQLILSENQLQVLVNEPEKKELENFVALCDTVMETRIIELQYIKTDFLLNYLPPGIRREQLVPVGDGNTLFFTGSSDSLHILNEALAVLDKPSVIVSYDVLVLQVQESDSINWKPDFSASPVKLGDRTSISGHLGSVLALNVDVVSVFGYTFAAELQAAVGENRAEIYVDTKLQGIVGKPIHFQNTNTFRYQDTAIDPDTGKPVYSGVTREIIAGLILDIEGWVSGDGMITTTVTASFSRRGADVSDNGNPPPTSEKLVTTEVRGKSGEPIVLSGLVQNDSTFVEEAVPFISKIPLIGWLFKSHQKNDEKSELIIYLVPHIQENIEEEFNNEF